MTNNDVRYTLPPHLVWEGVGSEVVVLDTASHTTHRLSGDLARSFLAAADGQPVSSPEVMALHNLGLIEPRSPVSRRSVVAGGVAGLGIGLTSLSLPAVAASSSTAHETPGTKTAPQAPPQATETPPEQSDTSNSDDSDPDDPPPPQPSITAASLAGGEWRWGPRTDAFAVFQTAGSLALPNPPVFAKDQLWQLSISNVDVDPAIATVDAFGDPEQFSLEFVFPLTGGLSGDPILLGTLTKVNDPTVFSEEFPIQQNSSG